MIILNKNASVIDYNAARVILVRAGYDLYRESDDKLLILNTACGSGYHIPTEEEEEIAKLTVDVGMFSECMDLDGSLNISIEGQELIDACSLFRILSMTFNPLFKAEPSPYSGHGRSQCHYIEQYLGSLSAIEYIKII
jgi:hypothetical protein